ncbi:hypothetical protein SAMN05421830_10521 [Desulfomicrobium norvegicum]|uniref:Uncharacterized protein n=2 Tax=Desulfomicrobium norvegicum (strain DSM 1741 / NCIMB 8310) TaxID=52561 RepID=A0A8G2F7W5_DESNO|nr:hypothetical protein SAMN05421830_10521 [Desulfomicrobium norvegicum]
MPDREIYTKFSGRIGRHARQGETRALCPGDKAVMRSIFLAWVLAAIFAALPVFAGVTGVAPGIKESQPAFKGPQPKVNVLKKPGFIPKTGEQSGSSTETQPETTQETPAQTVSDIQIQAVEFRTFPNLPACRLKLVVSLTNTGDTPTSSNLVLRPVYRLAAGVLETAASDIAVPSLAAGETRECMGSVPLRDNLEREVLVELRDGGTVLTSGVSQMPPVAKPSGDNVALGEATFAPPLVYVVVHNTGNADVTGVSLHMQGLPDTDGSQPVNIMSTGIPCLPAGGSGVAEFTVPATPFAAYKVRLSATEAIQQIAEKIYPRP